MVSGNIEIYANEKNILEGPPSSCSWWFSVGREQEGKGLSVTSDRTAQGHRKPVSRESAAKQVRGPELSAQHLRESYVRWLSLQLRGCLEAETGASPELPGQGETLPQLK